MFKTIKLRKIVEIMLTNLNLLRYNDYRGNTSKQEYHKKLKKSIKEDFMKRYLNICILTRVEKTGNLDDPYVEICEKLTVDGREIEIPEGCVAKVSYATYQKE